MGNAYRKTVDGTEMRAACPECQSPDVRKRMDDPLNRGELRDDDEPPWLCVACKQRFEEPVWTTMRTEPTPRGGMAQKLHDADPDELP